MKFELNQPVTTSTPTVVVDAGLRTGRHTFRLVVIDERGRRSQPADFVVTIALATPVRPPVGPTPVPIG